MEKQQALAQGFNTLVSIHKDLDYLAETLAFHRGSPVCVSGCGACCKQSFYVSGISARFIAHNVIHLPAERQQHIIERLEAWLVNEVPGVRLHFSEDGQHELEVRREEDSKVARLPCAFLDDDFRCLIHLWRDVTCRAWGVTRPIATYCRRPLSKTETMEAIQYVGSDAPIVQEIQRKTRGLEQLLRRNAPAFLLKGWLPYIVYVLLVPRDRLNLIKDRIQEIKSVPVTILIPWILTNEDYTQHCKEASLENSLIE